MRTHSIPTRVSLPTTRRSAFTLIELLIIIVILGILAAVVVPQFANLAGDTSRGTFVADIKTFSQAAEIFRNKEGQFLEDAGSGELPSGFDRYVDADDWENGTPIGGVWDSELHSFGVTSALGVHFMPGWGTQPDDEDMLAIDRTFDDGDLATGVFRQLAADRFYFILAP